MNIRPRRRPPRAHGDCRAASAVRQPRRRARAQGGERPSASWTGRAGWERVAPQGVPWGDSLGKGDGGRLGGLCTPVHALGYGGFRSVDASVTPRGKGMFSFISGMGHNSTCIKP